MARRRKKRDGLASRLRGIQGTRDDLRARLDADAALLDELDGHDGDVDAYTAQFLEDALRRNANGVVMTPGQRAFARRALDQLNN